jgi:hypothetical protein
MTNVRRLSLRNSDASARALFLCPAPIPIHDSPRSVTLPQLASGSSFHLLDVHSINGGLEPPLVFAHAGHTQAGAVQALLRAGVF